MVADHIVFPVESRSTYPYTLDGKHPGGGDALETFSILGVVAGATERLRLVTSVLVLPYRNPVLTAKMVASLDVLSRRPANLGCRRRLAERGIRSAEQPRLQCAGCRDR
jgi:alkanesulfonate monooxygenase SsuD/methylene tetrahydromethanopterin reductase-like flavin-dependent oxidoreductase (luciferase family)